MSSILRSIVLTVVLSPSLASAQLQVRVASLEPLEAATRCAAQPVLANEHWQSLLQIVTLERDVAKRRLVALEDSAAALAAGRPEDVDAQFFVAAVMGARSEVEEGRSKVRVAQALLDQLHGVLALEPEHAGSLHLLGRLHASVMRMDWVTRFVATRILGGAKLRTASWEEAERLLEAAVSSEPCVGDHYYQLARVYADQGEESRARHRLRELLELGPTGARDYRVWPQALQLLNDLDDG